MSLKSRKPTSPGPHHEPTPEYHRDMSAETAPIEAAGPADDHYEAEKEDFDGASIGDETSVASSVYQYAFENGRRVRHDGPAKALSSALSHHAPRR
jgi:hypothetical protein